MGTFRSRISIRCMLVLRGVECFVGEIDGVCGGGVGRYYYYHYCYFFYSSYF